VLVVRAGPRRFVAGVRPRRMACDLVEESWVEHPGLESSMERRMPKETQDRLLQVLGKQHECLEIGRVHLDSLAMLMHKARSQCRSSWWMPTTSPPRLRNATWWVRWEKHKLGQRTFA
jgi:hypothetical protein